MEKGLAVNIYIDRQYAFATAHGCQSPLVAKEVGNHTLSSHQKATKPVPRDNNLADKTAKEAAMEKNDHLCVGHCSVQATKSQFSRMPSLYGGRDHIG